MDSISSSAETSTVDDVRSTDTRPDSRFLTMAVGILVAILALAAILNLTTIITCIKAKGDVTFPESAVTTVSLSFAQTGKLYTSLDRPPFTPVAYGPVFYMG